MTDGDSNSYVERQALDIVTRGECVKISPVFPGQAWFAAFYHNLNICLLKLSDNATARSLLAHAEHEWLAFADNHSFYCGAPSGFRDRRDDTGRPNKAYLQYQFGFWAFADRCVPELAVLVPEFPQLSASFEVLTSISSQVFLDILAKFPGISSALTEHWLSIRGRLPIVMKGLAYHPSDSWSTTPHVDKALLALVLYCNNPKPPLLATPMGSNLPLAPAPHPPHLYERTGALLVPGALLSAVISANFLPAVHAVGPVTGNTVRCVSIAFLLVPHLQTNYMETNVERQSPSDLWSLPRVP